MAVLKVVKYGDPILRKKCSEVTHFDTISKVVDDMFDTMYEEEGIGLAANQVGFDMNLMIIDVTHTDESDEAQVFINGEITGSWGESVLDEGCLSIPEIRLDVKRPEFVRFKYRTMEGDEKEEEFSGLLARAIQHEYDHLNGILVIDHVSSMIRLQLKKQLKEIEKETYTNLKNEKFKNSYVL